jgi:hypothetical protein
MGQCVPSDGEETVWPAKNLACSRAFRGGKKPAHDGNRTSDFYADRAFWLGNNLDIQWEKCVKSALACSLPPWEWRRVRAW